MAPKTKSRAGTLLTTHFQTLLVKVDPKQNEMGIGVFNTGKFNAEHLYAVLVTTTERFDDGSTVPIFLVHDLSNGTILSIACIYCHVVSAT